ncbi:MAG: hypothetical protein KC800_14065 [Candidatus Eremiobacteraeota bacterium]|nr:hypothetical protein [Candidatus Eremiobacteraeota bacterium]
MPKYRYVIIDQHGRERTGTVEAPNAEVVRTALRAKLACVKNLWELTSSGHLTPCFEESVDSGSTRLWSLLTVVGGVLFTLCVLAWAWPRSSAPVDHPVTRINLQARGVLQNEMLGADLSELKLYGVMPEIFLQQEGTLDPDSGRFELSFEFESRQIPRELVIEVEQGHRRWEVDQKALEGGEALDLGTILLTAPPEEKRS